MIHLPKKLFNHLIGISLALGLTTFVSAQIIATNSITKGLPLAELLKKWEGTPLADIEQAAEKGDPLAEHYMGYCNAQGFRTAQNTEAGVKWYQRAMQNGYLPSANNLGVIYDRGQLGSIDMGKAIYYYTYAAERGLPSSQIALYGCYWAGTGVSPDHAQAMQWLRKAAEADDPRAQCLMGYRCENPEKDEFNRPLTKPDLIGAFNWYRRAAEQNWADGQYHLGLCYLEGKVVEPDENRGLELTRAAADKGLEDALRELAGLYARGVGEPRGEQDRPVQLLKRTKAWGDLIFRYEYGLGTERDLVAAAQCHCRIVMSGSWYYSINSLADKIDFKPPKRSFGMPLIATADEHVQIYGPLHDSREPSDDVLRALALYLKAALGDGPSALQIGNLYLNGQDAPKSMTDAWVWFTIAAQNGSTEASAKIIELESHISADALSKAKQQLPDLTQELNSVATSIRAVGGSLNSNP